VRYATRGSRPARLPRGPAACNPLPRNLRGDLGTTLRGDRSRTTPVRRYPVEPRLCGAASWEASLAGTRVSDVTRGTTTASWRRRLTGVEGASQGFGQGPAPRFASSPRMSVMFFLLERDAGRESGRSSDKLPEGLGSRNTPRRVSVTGSRRETGTTEADLTGPGRNSKVGRVAPELQTKV
jgi:hypothetical protein